MAEKTMRVCDVYGTTKSVGPFKVQIVNESGAVVYEQSADMCVRALDRAKRFVDRCVSLNPNKDGE